MPFGALESCSLAAAVCSRALGCGARRGPRVYYGAGSGPGRAPWRVLWASKVAQAGSFSRDCVPPRSAKAGPWKPQNVTFSFLFFLFEPFVFVFRSGALSEVPQQRSKARQPRYNGSRASSFSLCDSNEWCLSVCHPRILQLSKADTQTVSRTEVHFQPCSFHVVLSANCCVPISHRKLFKLWQSRHNSSRTSSSSFRDSYKRYFCVCAYAYVPS